MFRINIFLSIKNFFLVFFLKTSKKKILKLISKEFLKQTKKKYILFTNQGRVGFLYTLKYLKNLNPKKNEIIFSSYNLPEMINVAKNLNYKIKFCDINFKTGCLSLKELQKSISKNTAAVVLTNMFNDLNFSLKVRQIAKINNIKLIEDNAIYFDNFSKKRGKKYYSGFVGDYSIYSFNIMKNISALYGGALATNDEKFYRYFLKKQLEMKSFPLLKLLHQVLIYIVLKIMSVQFLYRIIFFRIIKVSHLNNYKFILKIFYPSLKFKKYKFNNSYFTKISKFSLKLIFLQILNKRDRLNNFKQRKIKNIYYQKKISALRCSSIHLIEINDYNFQNFLEFPLLVENKNELNNFLLKKGIELRYLHYRDCSNIFNKSSTQIIINSNIYEKKLICLPNHRKISLHYIDYIIENINKFYLKSSAV